MKSVPKLRHLRIKSKYIRFTTCQERASSQKARISIQGVKTNRHIGVTTTVSNIENKTLDTISAMLALHFAASTVSE